MKRLFDMVDSGLGLLALSPLFLIVAVWIKLDSPRPVFYRQVRVGRHNKDSGFSSSVRCVSGLTRGVW